MSIDKFYIEGIRTAERNKHYSDDVLIEKVSYLTKISKENQLSERYMQENNGRLAGYKRQLADRGIDYSTIPAFKPRVAVPKHVLVKQKDYKDKYKNSRQQGLNYIKKSKNTSLESVKKSIKTCQEKMKASKSPSKKALYSGMITGLTKKKIELNSQRKR